jgi:biotin transporter BioY
MCVEDGKKEWVISVESGQIWREKVQIFYFLLFLSHTLSLYHFGFFLLFLVSSLHISNREKNFIRTSFFSLLLERRESKRRGGGRRRWKEE